MARQYTKAERISEEVFRRKAAGETNREIEESDGLTLRQIKKLIMCQNNRAKRIVNGYLPRPKGRPRKNPITGAQSSQIQAVSPFVLPWDVRTATK